MTHIIVTAKMVPDLVEELEINEEGTGLDTSWLRLIINEFDDHAIEQAILLKEKIGGEVTVIAPDFEGMEEVLFTAAAKGADRLIKLTGNFEAGINNHALARAFQETIKSFEPDLVLTGVQANDDLDGSIGPYLAEFLGMSYVGYVSGVKIEGERAIVQKEYPGGLLAEMVVNLPAVLGIQASETPPRYVAVSKIRQTMNTVTIDEQEIPELDPSGATPINKMFLAEAAERAEIIEGDEEEIAAQFVKIFKEAGIL